MHNPCDNSITCVLLKNFIYLKAVSHIELSLKFSCRTSIIFALFNTSVNIYLHCTCCISLPQTHQISLIPARCHLRRTASSIWSHGSTAARAGVRRKPSAGLLLTHTTTMSPALSPSLASRFILLQRAALGGWMWPTATIQTAVRTPGRTETLAAGRIERGGRRERCLTSTAS